MTDHANRAANTGNRWAAGKLLSTWLVAILLWQTAPIAPAQTAWQGAAGPEGGSAAHVVSSESGLYGLVSGAVVRSSEGGRGRT